MKNSTKFLTVALVLLLGALSAYNLGLRAEYRRGTYKDPLRNTALLKFTNFTEVDVQAASAVNVKITAGPGYSVRVNDDAKQYVQVSQQGARLRIALAFPEDRAYLGSGDVVRITCPVLKRLTADGVYSLAGKPVTDSQVGRMGGSVRVQGFAADSLTLVQDHGTRVELTGNRLGYLRAAAGQSPGSQSVLRIGQDNRIQAAAFDMQQRSELELAGQIAQSSYQFGESAKVSFAGAALESLRR
ncbi:hypothetical protein [Hymenobacter sp.]|uniref:hypothetical protein n=1 Tax=Hymenobacter sp. TaxID=1898978 RepID=UPI00286B742C|nr:hypothetical protein [Hymenobacter sp.]